MGGTTFLRKIVPFLLLLLFVGNFTHRYPQFRNFLFMGLPCMMVGRCIREKADRAFSFLANPKYFWIYTIGAILLIVIEMTVLNWLFADRGVRCIYIFTLPLLLPIFYSALRNPKFGEGTWVAVIGRKYSAYIYIFHILVARFLLNFTDGENSLLTRCFFPFIVFAISLCIAWLFVELLQFLKLRI